MFTLNIDSKKVDFRTTINGFVEDFRNAKLTYSKDRLRIYEVEEFVLNLPFKSNVSFSFENEFLIGIDIGTKFDFFNSFHYDVKQSYKTYNDALIKIYGSPNRKKKLFETKSIWKFDDAIIEHYLFDRFGIQEVLSIKLKK